jgi:hypothetical protein
MLLSCWKNPNSYNNNNNVTYPPIKVWGYKPVYGTETAAKNIIYTDTARPVVNAGNIYAFHNYIFQMDAGLGIHVIDNSNPSAASRIGFITVKGCSQISIKDDKLYTNSYDDLVVLDFSNLATIHEVSRLKGVFTEYRYGSPLAQPPATGYYECPSYNGFVVGWVRDSVSKYSCYKN